MYMPRKLREKEGALSLVKCGTVQTFRRHLDRIDLSKFITYQ